MCKDAAEKIQGSKQNVGMNQIKGCHGNSKGVLKSRILEEDVLRLVQNLKKHLNVIFKHCARDVREFKQMQREVLNTIWNISR